MNITICFDNVPHTQVEALSVLAKLFTGDDDSLDVDDVAGVLDDAMELCTDFMLKHDQPLMHIRMTTLLMASTQPLLRALWYPDDVTDDQINIVEETLADIIATVRHGSVFQKPLPK